MLVAYPAMFDPVMMEIRRLNLRVAELEQMLQKLEGRE